VSDPRLDRLTRLEQSIEHNEVRKQELSLDTGKKLKEIRDDKLYEAKGYSSFSAYLESEGTIKRQHAKYYIEAFEAVENVTMNKFVHPPTTAWQARPLAQIDDAELQQIMREFAFGQVASPYAAKLPLQR
jgi:hypothetical protein